MGFRVWGEALLGFHAAAFRDVTCSSIWDSGVTFRIQDYASEVFRHFKRRLLQVRSGRNGHIRDPTKQVQVLIESFRVTG